MSISEITDIGSLLFSGIAVLVAGFAALVAWRTSARQNSLQARVVDIEEARERDRLLAARTAKVRASIQLAAPDFREQRIAGRRAATTLVVENQGDARASNVVVKLDGIPLMEHSLILRGDSEQTTFGPGVKASYHLAVTMGTPDVLHVSITWKDESGVDGHWDSELKL